MEGRNSVREERSSAALQAGALASLTQTPRDSASPRRSQTLGLDGEEGAELGVELSEEEIQAAEAAALQEKLKSVDVNHVQIKMKDLKQAEQKYIDDRKKAMEYQARKEKRLAEVTAQLEKAQQRYQQVQAELDAKRRKAESLSNQVEESSRLMKGISGDVSRLTRGLNMQEKVAKNILRPPHQPTPRQNTFRPQHRGSGGDSFIPLSEGHGSHDVCAAGRLPQPWQHNLVKHWRAVA